MEKSIEKYNKWKERILEKARKKDTEFAIEKAINNSKNVTQFINELLKKIVLLNKEL
jgi:hypothetical protein